MRKLNKKKIKWTIKEVEKHKEAILAKSELSELEFEIFLSLISLQIEFISYSEFEQFIQQAGEFTPDKDDTGYLTLAIKLNCSVWSNDKKLKEQNRVKVYSTDELLKLI